MLWGIGKSIFEQPSARGLGAALILLNLSRGPGA